MYTPAIKFENDHVYIIDQTKIPGEFDYIEITSADDAFIAFQELKVRGAPAIGILAAYSIFVEAVKLSTSTPADIVRRLDEVSEYLYSSRPTAVNLGWALKRMQQVYRDDSVSDLQDLLKKIRSEALEIHEEDKKACHQIGINGLPLISDPCNILTHCNTGSLATGGWGTALGVVYAAREAGRKIHVYVDETRPLGQGARLTFWELMQNQVPCTLITDSTAASLMKEGKIDLIVFGADRIAKNGDVANKIGSYSLAALARVHNIPCYAAAPRSTFDLSLDSGKKIPIEQRKSKEILQIYGYDNNLSDFASVYNPAFDVTPAGFLAGIITEAGIIRKPNSKSILNFLT